MKGAGVRVLSHCGCGGAGSRARTQVAAAAGCNAGGGCAAGLRAEHQNAGGAHARIGHGGASPAANRRACRPILTQATAADTGA